MPYPLILGKTTFRCPCFSHPKLLPATQERSGSPWLALAPLSPVHTFCSSRSPLPTVSAVLQPFGISCAQLRALPPSLLPLAIQPLSRGRSGLPRAQFDDVCLLCVIFHGALLLSGVLPNSLLC